MSDKNRLVSESIEAWPPVWTFTGEHHPLSDGKGWVRPYMIDQPMPRAWDTDENASAMLLERMPMYVTMKHFQGGWQIWWPDPSGKAQSVVVAHEDRKTAIRDAYLRYITEKSNG